MNYSIIYEKNNRSKQFSIILLLAIVIILCWQILGLWNTPQPLQPLLDKKIQARVQITSIVQVQDTAEKVWRFNASIKEIMSVLDTTQTLNQLLHSNRSANIRVSWYSGLKRPNKPPKLGETWEIWFKLKAIWGRVNEAGFDYERWAFANHLQGRAYVLNKYLNKRNDIYPVSWWLKLRQDLISRLDAFQFDWKQLALLRALMVGDRSQLTQQHWQVYQATGIAHLLAISGLHIGMAGLFFGLLLGWMWRRSSRCCDWIPVPIIMLIGIILGGGIYALLSGFQLPAQRAWLMLLFAGIFVFRKRFIPSWLILALAFIIILIIDIRAIFQLGFWLSFSAVLFILLCFRYICIKQEFIENSWSITEKTSGLKKHLAINWRKIRILIFTFLTIQVVLTIGLLPLLIYGFQQASWISPVANFIILPIISLVIVPLLLCAIVIHILLPFWDMPFYGLLRLSDVLLDWVNQLSFSLAELIGGVWYLGEITLWQTILSMGCFFIFFLLKKTKQSIVIMLLAIVILLPIKQLFNQVSEQRLIVRVLDVSQGLSLLLQTQHLSLIYDTGFTSISKQVIEPLFKQQYRQPNRLIISHYNFDHSAGKDYLLSRYPNLAVQDNLNCVGQFHADGYDFELLQAKINLPIKAANNNHSCLVRVSYQGEGLMLLTGDIEASAERYLLNNKLDKLRNKVLLVPHHGSKTSSTQEFLEAVKPQFGIISAGYSNSFKHPNPSVVKRLKLNNTIVLKTACSGQINLEFQKNQLYQITQLRHDKPRLWRNQC